MSPDEKRLYRVIRAQVRSAMKDHPAPFPHTFADSVAKRVFGQLVKGDGKELLRKVAFGGISSALGLKTGPNAG